jgi:hypothetical protein
MLCYLSFFRSNNTKQNEGLRRKYYWARELLDIMQQDLSQGCQQYLWQVGPAYLHAERPMF